jgi:hypothetical protein
VLAISLHSPELYQDQNIISNYREASQDSLANFYNIPSNTRAMWHRQPNTKALVTALVNKVVDFKAKLADIVPPLKQERDTTQSYNKIDAKTFTKLQLYSKVCSADSWRRKSVAFGPPIRIVPFPVANSSCYIDLRGVSCCITDLDYSHHSEYRRDVLVVVARRVRPSKSLRPYSSLYYRALSLGHSSFATPMK